MTFPVKGDEMVTSDFHELLLLENRASVAHQKDIGMPLLAALDECNCALTKIERLTQLALRHPSLQEAALTLILLQCHQTDAHVGELDLHGSVSFAGLCPT